MGSAIGGCLAAILLLGALTKTVGLARNDRALAARLGWLPSGLRGRYPMLSGWLIVLAEAVAVTALIVALPMGLLFSASLLTAFLVRGLTHNKNRVPCSCFGGLLEFGNSSRAINLRNAALAGAALIALATTISTINPGTSSWGPSLSVASLLTGAIVLGLLLAAELVFNELNAGSIRKEAHGQ